MKKNKDTGKEFVEKLFSGKGVVIDAPDGKMKVGGCPSMNFNFTDMSKLDKLFSGAKSLSTRIPAGEAEDWIDLKCFLEDTGAEFFITLNLKKGIGKMSMKSDGYASILVGEFARVMIGVSEEDFRKKSKETEKYWRKIQEILAS